MIRFAGTPLMPEPAWSTRIGEHGASLWVGEREVGSPVNVRFTWDGKLVWRSLGLSVRDARGRLQKGKQKDALRIAKERFGDALAEGRNPLATEDTGPRPFMLKEAFSTALKLNTGMFVADSTHRRDMLRIAVTVQRALKPTFSLADLLPSTGATSSSRHFSPAPSRPAGGLPRKRSSCSTRLPDG